MEKNDEKLSVANFMLESCGFYIHVAINKMHDSKNLVIPEYLKKHQSAILYFSKQAEIPIPDLKVDSSGVFGTLQFNGNPFTCFIPWNNVFALILADDRVTYDPKGRIWQEDIPMECNKTLLHNSISDYCPEIVPPPPSPMQHHSEEKLAEVINLDEYRVRKFLKRK